MSTSNLPEKDKLILFGKTAGLCEFPGCGKRLYEEGLTKLNINFSQFSHIIADSPNGPRGDKNKSEELGKDINNIILLCPEHHKLVDSAEQEFTPQVLHQYKKDHEELVHKLTDIKNIEPSTVLIYAANVGGNSCPVSYDQANLTIFPLHYPADKIPITISFNQKQRTERDQMFWEEEISNLNYYFEQHVKRLIDHGDIKHLSVFAIAPMPLLIQLGALLTDLVPTDIYQLHREPQTWEWQKGEDKEIFHIIRPEYEHNKPVLVFSLSSDITNRIKGYYNDESEISLWEVRVDNPNNDYLKSKEQLSEFRLKMRMVYEDIDKHSAKGNIEVYMAMSNACAVELGRVRMPKADRHLDLYDYFEGSDHKVLTI
mgnify:CR=1 FL=1